MTKYLKQRQLEFYHSQCLNILRIEDKGLDAIFSLLNSLEISLKDDKFHECRQLLCLVKELQSGVDKLNIESNGYYEMYKKLGGEIYE